MGAGFGVHACVWQAEAFHGTAVDQVLLDDLRGIFRLHVAVPNCLGIDDDRGAVFALVEAEGFVDPHSVAEAGRFGDLLQLRVQFALAVSGARGSGSAFRADVVADKDVVLEEGQMKPPVSRLQVDYRSGSLWPAGRFRMTNFPHFIALDEASSERMIA
jgi:hypothetical protein